MKVPEPIGLLDVGQLLGVRHLLPAAAEPLGDLSVVNVRLLLHDSPPLVVREHHERVHRPLYLVRVVASLK